MEPADDYIGGVRMMNAQAQDARDWLIEHDDVVARENGSHAAISLAGDMLESPSVGGFPRG